jgi:hypothetical protein
MIDVSTIQTFPIPKELLQLQQANSALTKQNAELTTKSSNLLWLLAGAAIVGVVVYININNKLDEQKYTQQ